MTIPTNAESVTCWESKAAIPRVRSILSARLTFLLGPTCRGKRSLRRRAGHSKASSYDDRSPGPASAAVQVGCRLPPEARLIECSKRWTLTTTITDS